MIQYILFENFIIFGLIFIASTVVLINLITLILNIILSLYIRFKKIS